MTTSTGAHMTKSPTSHCVINLVPPREFWAPLQQHRTLNVREARCGPHISFIDPFVTLEHYDQVAELLQAELSQMEPFTITLQNFKCFVHKNSCTLYLEPSTDPSGAIQHLLDRIMKIIPQCNDQQRKSSNNVFVPHFTIAKLKNQTKALEMKKQMEKDWKPITFQLKEIYLLHRQNVDPFVVKHVVHLGQNPTRPYFGSGSADPESTVAKSVVVCGLPKNVLRFDKELMTFMNDAGFNPVKAEVTLNPDGKPRPLGVVEFSSQEEAAKAVAEFNYQPYRADHVYLKPLEEMFFPDVIGGCCSLKAVKSASYTAI